MKKKAIIRTLLGFPLGVCIGYTITIIMSILIADGLYYPFVQQFEEQVGSEIGAVVLQYLLSGILGAACAGGSCVWDLNDWGFFKQTIVHFIIIAGSMFPIAWFLWWMPHSILGILSYIGIFLTIYFIIFIIMFVYWKQKIKRLDLYIQMKKTSNEKM